MRKRVDERQTAVAVVREVVAVYYCFFIENKLGA